MLTFEIEEERTVTALKNSVCRDEKPFGRTSQAIRTSRTSNLGV